LGHPTILPRAPERPERRRERRLAFLAVGEQNFLAEVVAARRLAIAVPREPKERWV